MNADVLDEVLALLEDFRAVGEEAWTEHEAVAERHILEGVRAGQLQLTELADTREMLTRTLAVQHVVAFLLDQGFEDITVEAIMVAGETGFTQDELDALEDGMAPERSKIDEFRLRAFFAHYAMVCDQQQAQALLNPPLG